MLGGSHPDIHDGGGLKRVCGQEMTVRVLAENHVPDRNRCRLGRHRGSPLVDGPLIGYAPPAGTCPRPDERLGTVAGICEPNDRFAQQERVGLPSTGTSSGHTFSPHDAAARLAGRTETFAGSRRSASIAGPVDGPRESRPAGPDSRGWNDGGRKSDAARVERGWQPAATVVRRGVRLDD